MSATQQIPIHKTIHIDASRDKIWNALLQKENFEKWCAAFNPDCTYEGNWAVGTNVKFLGTHPETGEVGGMITRITDNIPGEYVRGEHIGVIEKGKEIFDGPDADDWVGSSESYRITGESQPYALVVEAGAPESMHAWFDETWDKALATLKEIAESS